MHGATVKPSAYVPPSMWATKARYVRDKIIHLLFTYKIKKLGGMLNTKRRAP
jgi:hypothetical protein